jgi:antitoxin component HigA of HigAB toxin-antitoxin module
MTMSVNQLPNQSPNQSSGRDRFAVLTMNVLAALILLVAVAAAAPVNVPGIGPPSSIEVIKFRMEQGGLKQAGFVPFIGSKGRASEVLPRNRPLPDAR